MTPRGAAPLIAMRLAGQCPAGEVWITVGEGREPDWWKWSNTLSMPELLIRPDDPIDLLDLRCVHGLNVIMFSEAWDERAARVHDRLIEYAEEVCVMSPAFELDIGWRWIREYGRIEFGETHWIKDYSDAEDERGRASLRSDKAAYAAATLLEREIRLSAPWVSRLSRAILAQTRESAPWPR